MRNGQVIKIIEEGDPLPDGNGHFSGFGTTIQGGRFAALNNNGHVFFAGRFDSSPVDDEGWLYWDGIENFMVARQGENAPGGTGTFNIQIGASVINDNNQVVFQDNLNSPPNAPSTIFLYDHNTREVTRIIQQLELFNGETITSGPVNIGNLTNAGDFASRITTEDTMGDSTQRMIRTTVNGLVTLVDDTQSVPGLGDILSISALRPTLNEANQVAFESNIGALRTLLLYDNGPLIPISVEDDPVPGSRANFDEFVSYFC